MGDVKKFRCPGLREEGVKVGKAEAGEVQSQLIC